MSILRRLFLLAHWFGTPILWFTKLVGGCQEVSSRHYGRPCPKLLECRVVPDANLLQPRRI